MLAINTTSSRTRPCWNSATITGGGLNVASVSNVIIRNINFRNWSDDAINVQYSTRVWIDHNSFSNGSDGAVDIKDAVHADPEKSRSVYNWVMEVCVKLGANPADLVPFEKYASAAHGRVRPSSAARALNNGVPFIERTDRLVQLLGAQLGMSNPVVDATVKQVDARLEANRKKAA